MLMILKQRGQVQTRYKEDIFYNKCADTKKLVVQKGVHAPSLQNI